MTMMIPEKERIRKFLRSRGLDVFTSVPEKHIVDIVTSATSAGFSGKTTQMCRYSENHRTTIGHFLNKGKWDDEKLEREMSKQCYEIVGRVAEERNVPVFIAIDDTTNPKKKPSSRAERPMEGGAYVYSHLQGKVVWGHQALAALISGGDTALCYKLERTGKTPGGKIEQILQIAASLPMAQQPAYTLMDSWYTCPKLVDAFLAKGYHTIGALKTNRIIYPGGIRISISEFAPFIHKSDASLVTVGKDRYWIYRYEGKLNSIDNAVVLLSYPEDAFGEPTALRAFLCTDTTLDTPTILQYYKNRWDIEVFFKQQKNLLGFKGYQIRSAKGIDRLWLILSLASFYCILTRDMPLGDAVRDCRTAIATDFAFLFYCAGRDGLPFESLPLKAVC